MATVTGLTAARMLEIEAASIVDARVEDGELILIKHDGTEINVGAIDGPAGPPGPQGPAGLSAIPGEVKMWPGAALPAEGTYGKWVWADGAIYPIATYPIAAAHIADVWNTLGNFLSDPGAGNFRVPDLRGMVPAGIDAMPGGSRPTDGRPHITRADGAVQAKPIGKETHVLAPGEMAQHSHTVNPHNHGGATGAADRSLATSSGGPYITDSGGVDSGYRWGTAGTIAYKRSDVGGVDHLHGIGTESPGTNNAGSDNAHENVQPTVMVPYIVSLAG